MVQDSINRRVFGSGGEGGTEVGDRLLMDEEGHHLPPVTHPVLDVPTLPLGPLPPTSTVVPV